MFVSDYVVVSLCMCVGLSLCVHLCTGVKARVQCQVALLIPFVLCILLFLVVCVHPLESAHAPMPRQVCGSQFSISTIWVLRMELWLSGLMAGTFT